jgi:hypothetical protein
MAAEGSAETHAEKVYRQLIRSTENARTRKNLEILWAALEKMRVDAVPDYNIARVGKYSKQLGGIQAQSIRNANGERFRDLIDAYAATVGKSRAKLPARAPSNVDLAIERITDNGSRTALKMMMEDRRRLLEENQKLRHAYKKLSVDTVNLGHVGASPAPEQGRMVLTAPDRATVDELLLGAVQRFLSDDWQKERAWLIEPDGSITDTATMGDLVAPPGFVDALRQLLHGNRSSAAES